VIFKKKYNNEDHHSFADVLRQFLYQDARMDRPPASACFAVAGPVKNNKVRFTNRDSWSIDGDEISAQFNIRTVSLINDFLAMGYGIMTLDHDRECEVLQKGERHPDSPIACIGAGTGLGECFLTPDANGQYTCFASEGGHAEFAPRDEVSGRCACIHIYPLPCLIYRNCLYSWNSTFYVS
jgi:glucokinase